MSIYNKRCVECIPENQSLEKKKQYIYDNKIDLKKIQRRANMFYFNGLISADAVRTSNKRTQPFLILIRIKY